MQKKATYLSITLVSMGLGALTGLFLDFINGETDLSEFGLILIGIPINALMLLILGVPLILILSNMTRALRRLSEGKTAQKIEPLPLGLLAGLIEPLNALIANQQEFQMARGRLYEQISEVAAQEERKRLARDLHDSIKQQVFSISISAAAAHTHLDNNPSAAREALIDVKQSAQEAMVEMRALLQQLSPAPLEKSGLVEALREQCEALSYRTGAKVKTTFGQLPPDEQLPPGTQAVIFRIAQEALSNIARHARAQHVHLQMEIVDEQFVLQIHDDGQGFDMDVQPDGMGLSNMQNRTESLQGQFEIQSQKGEGTQLKVVIPLTKPQEEDSKVFEQVEVQRKSVMTRYWFFSGSIAAIIFSVVLLLGRAINHPDDFAPDAITQGIMVVLVITFFISVPLAFTSFRQGRSEKEVLLNEVNHDSRVTYWLKRHEYMGYLSVGIFAAWLMPLLVIHEALPNVLPLVVSGVFLVMTGWYYWQMHNIYQAELALMRPDERVEELNVRIRELRNSWFTLGFLIVIQLITFDMNGDFYFPPRTEDNWMSFFLILLTVLLMLNQVAQAFFYRQWREDARR